MTQTKVLLPVFLSIITLSYTIVGINGEPRVAVAHLISPNVTGTILFTETDNGLRVSGVITGLGSGKYGFHIHELGDTTTCDTTGPHFNPDSVNHGGRDHEVRHVGDMGNVEFVGTGTPVANVDFVDSVMTLRGRNTILGRSLVLHEREDDLGLGGHELSLTTGNAGPRIACGVIGIRSPNTPWNSAKSVLPSIVLLLCGLFFFASFS
ncbi:uncharacterized protein [Epargyreus clarus]|uniref:uncharacterized protein n=1 Tax=Epargyreus clarus TaxID=520877 RepID=UPI003C2E8694